MQFQRKEQWVKHYSSCHLILLVGEGDFSFSLALANAFCSASNIVATSLDSHYTVATKYAKAKSNLETLENMGATILHGVDATNMRFHPDLKMMKFDRIVYNFPHAGFKGKEDNIQLIALHQLLVFGFLKIASCLLQLNGEVHVTHKTEQPYIQWKLDELASWNSLVLIERADFNINDYPGYSNKRGDGVNCDQPFRLGECCTYRFGIDNDGKKKVQKTKVATSQMIDADGWDDGLGPTSQMIDASGWDTNGWDTSQMINASGWDANRWDTSQMTNANGWDTSQMINANGWDANGWETSQMIDASGWDANGWDTSQMINASGWDANGWDTSQTIDANGWDANGCETSQMIDANGWD